MSDLSIIPLEDGFETQLAQDWNGAVGTVYVLDTPSYTPTTTNTYIVVNPGKTNMQIAEITDYDSTANTLTVSNVTLLKGLGINSTAPASSHATGSKVIISDNYQFWVDIQTAINSKLDDTGGTMTGLLQFSGTTHAGIKLLSLTTVQRDALSASNGMIIYNSTTGELNQYIGGAWSAVAAGSTQPTASTTVLGKIKTDVAPAGDPVALITDNPKYDALAGTSGTPSTSNPYVTLEGLVIAAPVGVISPFAGFTAPSGWLLADGTAVSRATYATLFSLINPSLGTATMTIATPCVVSLTAHGLVLDDIVYFTTTGALPTGLAINTRYYVITAGLTADAFQISATKGGSAINTTGSQSGVHTLRRSPYGVGDGTTTFNVPNIKGSVVVGRDSSQTEFNSVGETGGEKTHTMLETELAAHTHTLTYYNSGADVRVPSSNTKDLGASIGTSVTSSTGGSAPFNVLQPYITLNYIIKT